MILRNGPQRHLFIALYILVPLFYVSSCSLRCSSYLYSYMLFFCYGFALLSPTQRHQGYHELLSFMCTQSDFTTHIVFHAEWIFFFYTFVKYIKQISKKVSMFQWNSSEQHVFTLTIEKDDTACQRKKSLKLNPVRIIQRTQSKYLYVSPFGTSSSIHLLKIDHSDVYKHNKCQGITFKESRISKRRSE